MASSKATQLAILGTDEASTQHSGRDSAICPRPESNATRGQISKIVSNAAGFSEDPGPQHYTDVPLGSTFYDYINRLTNRGIMSGYNTPGECPSGAPCFHPENNASRGQASKIVANTFFPDCQTPARVARRANP